MSHWNHSLIKARKSHRCEYCSRMIRPREMYYRGAGMDGSTAWSWKWCLHCDAVLGAVLQQMGHPDEYDSGCIADWVQKSIPEARIRAQWRRKWERFDGSLYPLPHKVSAHRLLQDSLPFGSESA